MNHKHQYTSLHQHIQMYALVCLVKGFFATIGINRRSMFDAITNFGNVYTFWRIDFLLLLLLLEKLKLCQTNGTVDRIRCLGKKSFRAEKQTREYGSFLKMPVIDCIIYHDEYYQAITQMMNYSIKMFIGLFC